MYLRKSRADLEAEARGEGETLAKHKKALLKLAREKNLNIVKIYEEIVSGETIIHRPQMLKLLEEVDHGKYDAVLCMDLDRLGRGNMQDQGLILNTFKQSNTKIITPRKTYDLNNEWDEEYSEFETFMARRELKIITRRMQSGRVRSIEDGNYIATNPPYGYIIKELDNGRTLEPHPEQADIVRMIFEWYTHEDADKRIGTNMIANKLNEMGIKTYTGKTWQSSSVLNILKNAVYAGRIQWKRKEIKKSTEPGKVKDTRTRPRDEWIDVQGKHEPLISMEVYQKAQEILKTRYHVPYQLTNGVRNPLAGIVKCGFCGGSMVFRPYVKQKPHIKCYNQPRCRCKASNFELVEQKLLHGLKEWLEAYKAQWEVHKPTETEIGIDELSLKEKSIHALQKELEQLEIQKSKLFDLLERGIYTEEIFLERSNNIANRINETHTAIEKIEREIEFEREKLKAKQDIIPRVEHVLDLYDKTDDPKKKNALLKSVLEKAVYKKEKWQCRDDFELILYPKVPHYYLRQITS
jgi:DNA invertase Pin-like site-specific DNA recombinase